MSGIKTASFVLELKAMDKRRAVQIEKVRWNWKGNHLQALMLRDDLLHPHISGNKYRKLQALFQAVPHENMGIASCGGPHSNHLHALAAAGHEWGRKTLGIVPGKHFSYVSPTLAQCKQWGMELVMVSRQEMVDIRFAVQLPHPISHLSEAWFWCGEGGYGPCFFQGYQTLDIPPEGIQYIHVGVGSGGTLGGLLRNQALQRVKLYAYPCAPLTPDLCERVGDDTGDRMQWCADHLEVPYGAMSSELLDFCQSFKAQTNIVLDPIYTAKMMKYVSDHPHPSMLNDSFSDLFIHTGGVQGWSGFTEKYIVDFWTG